MAELIKLFEFGKILEPFYVIHVVGIYFVEEQVAVLKPPGMNRYNQNAFGE